MARWVLDDEHPENEEQSTSEDDDELDVPDEHPQPPRQRIKVSLKQNTQSAAHEQLCHVCGQKGHQAGFVGSVYLDCINKPCYLCKQHGHTTATCPHRVAPETGCTSAVHSQAESLLQSVLDRPCDITPWGRHLKTAVKVPHYAVDAAILKVLSRRCTCLEYHPRNNNLVLCGDKKGLVAVWDYVKVHERTVYSTFHDCLVNTLKFLPQLDGMSCVTASSDGMCKIFDVETGAAETVCNLNPGGWVPGVTKEKDWGMFYGLDVCGSHTLAAGDTFGRLHLLDTRTHTPQHVVQIQKKNTKVAHIHANPADPNILLTCGGDHVARLLDIRLLSNQSGGGSSGGGGGSGGGGAGSGSGGNAGQGGAQGKFPVSRGGAQQTSVAELASYNHKRAINSAYFSPITGSRIITTCQDNRLRVWDAVHTFGTGAPDREIVHSHDFNRHLTPFKAEFDPKDHRERLVVIGRYISESFDGVALHPIDIMDVATGHLLRQLIDPNLTTISPVNKPHPRMDVIISGSSRSLYAWRPLEEEEEEDEKQGEGVPGASRTEGPSTPHRRGPSRFVSFDVDDERKRAARARGNAGSNAQQQTDRDGSSDEEEQGGRGPVKKKKKTTAKTKTEESGGGKKKK